MRRLRRCDHKAPFTSAEWTWTPKKTTSRQICACARLQESECLCVWPHSHAMNEIWLSLREIYAHIFTTENAPRHFIYLSYFFLSSCMWSLKCGNFENEKIMQFSVCGHKWSDFCRHDENQRKIMRANHKKWIISFSWIRNNDVHFQRKHEKWKRENY